MKELMKPGIGESCNSCGICCEISLCNVGAFLLKKNAYLGEKRIYQKCPALETKKDGRKLCGLIINPNKYLGKTHYPERIISKHISVIIGKGIGCDELANVTDHAEELKLIEFLNKFSQDEDFIAKVNKSVEFVVKLRNLLN